MKSGKWYTRQSHIGASQHKKEGAMQDFVHLTARTKWESTVHLRHPKCVHLYFLIGGYNQSATTWNRFVESVFQNPNDGVAIIGRRGENSKTFVGLMSLAEQIDEVEAAIFWLLRQSDFVGIEVILVGHSVGGLIAREIATRHPEAIHGLVQIAPVPAQRFALLGNWSFWRHGGFLAALAALGGILNGRGFIPPARSVKELFTGPVLENDLWEYIGILVPDSVRVFVELLFFYDGKKSWKQVTKNMTGVNAIVIAPNDATIPQKALERMGTKYVHYLEHGTPHCIQFADDATWRRNQLTLRVALQCLPEMTFPKEQTR